MDAIQPAAAWQIIAAVIIFIIAYGLMLTGTVHRAAAAWGGAVLMLALGIVSLSSAYRTHIAWQTIGLLIGMMILSGVTARTGLFQYIALKSAQKAQGSAPKLLVLLSVIAAAGSAAVDPVVTMIVLVPVTIRIASALGISALPFLVAEMLTGTVGGTATLIGSAGNMLLGSSGLTGLTFNGFLLHLAPLSVLLLAVQLLVLWRVYAKEWKETAVNRDELMSLDASAYMPSRSLLLKVWIVWALTLIAFLLHQPLRMPVAAIALIGALLLVTLTVRSRTEAEEAVHSVEWGTAGALIAVFILAGGLADTGVWETLAVKTMELTSGNLMFVSLLVLWVSGIVSAAVDQAPLVAAMIPLIRQIGAHMELAFGWQLNPVWWSLALGAGLGGGATLIGSHANLIAAGIAMKEGRGIPFAKFMKIGIPLTLLSLLISTVYVIAVFF
ncbi:Arsenical pump membrane protein [Paenibacillus konkukensis]|uniref:Arsenical pump membrane protein n=1 Tax=Paenibacillus konkukensis TaxID=2020716 RepID=A0ABY4RYC5_9BACL|nr:SLC13 family permease [Paenibacillus konkukensis]UQZ86780.1 Arsenical pump membrane protein [Paenibacillus konkukensis]